MTGGYAELRPSPRLAPYVECYWTRKDTAARDVRVLPDGCVDVLYSARKGEPSGLTVVGLMTASAAHTVHAGQAFFGVRFRPGMATAFLRDASRLTDRVEPLESFWGNRARAILERLAESSTFQARAAAVEEFLTPVKQLPEVTCLSERQLRRVCIERTGVPPKYLSRILRFRAASRRIDRIVATGAQPHWADFAAACGYFDQAHFIREFQEFAGFTPGRFLQSLREANG